MRCVILGTTKCAESLALGVIEAGAKLVGMINLEQDLWPNNSIDLRPFANLHGVEYFEICNINQEAKLIQSLNCDLLICNWPRILQPHILAIPKFTLCPHPTLLPKNRGRHALHWSKVLGLSEGGLTFFIPDSGIDSGKIVLQLRHRIEKDDDINCLNDKINQLAYEGIKTILSNQKLLLEAKAQQGEPNYWRKRSVHDVILDMRMSALMICSTIQSFAPPYPCAKLLVENTLIDIALGESVEIEGIGHLEHGKILALGDDFFILKCADGAIKLTPKEKSHCEHVAKILRGGGAYIHPPTYYLALGGSDVLSQGNFGANGFFKPR